MCCRGGGVTHHSILSYQERLYGYLEQLALQRSTSAAATLPSGQRAASRDAEDPASLFRQAPSRGAGDNPLLEEVGRFAGTTTFMRALHAQQDRGALQQAFPLGFAAGCTEEQLLGQATPATVGMLMDLGSTTLKHG